MLTTDSGRDHLGVARLDVRNGELTWLVTDDEHDVTARLSPDGETLLVVTDDDGTSRLAVHDVDGTFRHAVGLPAELRGGVADFLAVPRWSPDGTGLAITWTDPATPADVLLVDAARGRSRRRGLVPRAAGGPRPRRPHQPRRADARRRDRAVLRLLARRSRRGRA